MAVQLEQGPLVLKLNELEEILLDMEITLNNRPLSYVEDQWWIQSGFQDFWKSVRFSSIMICFFPSS